MSSVSDHHSVQIGDIEAFMAVGVPEGLPQCLDIFLPLKRVIVSLIEHGLGCPNVSFGIDCDLRP